MATAIDKHNDEHQIRNLIDHWAGAARAGELETVMACYTPDVVAFDAIMALQCRGTDDYREHWKKCMSFIPEGEMILEVHHLNVEIGDGLAFAYYLSRCGGCDDKGNEQVGWMRATVCCRKTDEGWRIAHEHYSSPFDPQSMNAMVELEP